MFDREMSEQFKRYLEIVERTDEQFVIKNSHVGNYPNSIFFSVENFNDTLGVENLVGFSISIGQIVEKLVNLNYHVCLDKLFKALNVPDSLSTKEKIAYYQLIQKD